MIEALNPIHETTVLVGDGALRRLAELGVRLERITAALDAGDLAARQADEFSPVTAAGTLRWIETVHTLRAGLCADGWALNDDRNSPRVVDATGRTAIVPVSGTAATGREDEEPRPARRRGPASSRAVRINGQLELNLPALIADMAAEKSGRVSTWFLLYYRSEEDELRAELSLPVVVTDEGAVTGWRERLLLPARTFGAEVRTPDDAGGDDDVDFDIAAL